MRNKKSQRPHGVLVLALLVAASLVLGAAGLVAFTWRTVDQEVSTRETQLVRRAIQRTSVRIGRETTSAAEWDDAFIHTEQRDLPWIDSYLAGYYHTSFDHDLTLLFDERLRLLYAAKDGRRISLDEAAPLAEAARGLAKDVQAEELRLRPGLTGADARDSSSLAWREIMLTDGRSAYLVGVASMLPSHWLLTGDKPTMIVVSGRRIDAEFLRELEADLGISQARLVWDPGAQGVGSAPLLTAAGREAAHIAWRPARPGTQVIRSAAEPIALALALLAAICLALIWQIRRLLDGLAQKGRALEDSLEELVEARDQARAGSRAKSQFIANISHEIRTPLNGVLGMAQAMEKEELSPRQRERLDVVRQSGETLLAILNDVLDLSKIEAGKLELEMADFDLSALAAGAHAAFTALAERKGLEFCLTVADEAKGRYRSDPTRIRQVLYNLISNAVKFTSEGEVRVAVIRREARLVFEVSDTGVGMDETERNRLFESFQQADASTTRRFGGTGLGLAICRELVERLGGAIRVRSRPGDGSVFTVELPLERLGDEASAAAREDEQEAAPQELSRPLKVLAAEDNAVNQLVIRTLLLQVGVEPTIVGDGAAALQAWRDADWDLILMDIQMPHMDGPTATRAIRDEEHVSGRMRTPIVALTANAMSHQVDEYLGSGMDGLVAKPIDVQQLLEAMVKVVDARQAAASPTVAASAA
ncbi:ATP-binding protein [Phenylobacterium sp.]|uniref:hybrid sensor histidine kinase/response regulator n=1 Tax=Phenylobacterium sp. TaxID=1871053 RepID=UPI002812006A|nr:ATP-binding protein [Phenylobacterium sp.]